MEVKNGWKLVQETSLVGTNIFSKIWKSKFGLQTHRSFAIMKSNITYNISYCKFTEHGDLFAFTVAGVHEWWFGWCFVIQRKSDGHVRDPDVWHFNGLLNHFRAEKKNELILRDIHLVWVTKTSVKKIRDITESSVSPPKESRLKLLGRGHIKWLFSKGIPPKSPLIQV